MGKCTTTIQKIIFDVSDPQITQVRIEIDFEGDCPIGIYRVYEKSFPARRSVLELLEKEVPHYLEW